MATQSSDLSPEDLTEMYRLMLMGRRFTEQIFEWLEEEGRLPTALMPSAGQEAVGVGASYSLRADDWVLPSLRTTEAFFTRGVTYQQEMNAFMGNSASISGGKESFHHCGYPDLGILAGTALVAAQIPVAVGAGVAFRMQKTDRVMVCFFGDGSSNRGDFHEGLNLAAVLKAPVVFVCENNLYTQTISTSVAMAIEDIADRASGYGMPGEVVDGQDVLAVHNATQRAVARARRGDGPTLLECKTYRYKVHHPHLPEIRPKEEIARWMERDPIKILGDSLEAAGYMDKTSIESMDTALREELMEAMRRAEATPPPAPGEAFTQVYSEALERIGL